MKYITACFVLAALLGEEQTNAIRLTTQFSDDLIKSLADDMQKDVDADTPAAEEPKPKPVAKPKAKTAEKKAKKEDKKAKKAAAPKKEAKKEEEEIPMDQAAIKAYSSVIADAAEDSEPQTPVIYKKENIQDDAAPVKTLEQAYNPDPMGSMIQNEISCIKDASIKAAKEKDE